MLVAVVEAAGVLTRSRRGHGQGSKNPSGVSNAVGPPSQAYLARQFRRHGIDHYLSRCAPGLGEEYKKRYGLQLFGDGLGQTP